MNAVESDLPQKKHWLIGLLLFLQIGLVADCYFSYLFWNISIRILRETFYYSLYDTGVNVFSILLLFVFVIPGIIAIPFMIFPKVREWIHFRLRGPLLACAHFLIVFLFSFLLIRNPASRCCLEGVILILLVLVYDIRLCRSPTVKNPKLVHKNNVSILCAIRFADSQIVAIFACCVMRYIGHGEMPFFSPITPAFAIVNLTFGFGCVMYYMIEESALFTPWFLNREVYSTSISLITNSFSLLPPPPPKSDVTKKKVNCFVLCGKGFCTFIFGFLFCLLGWSLGFGSLMHLLTKFALNPYSLGQWTRNELHPELLSFITLTLIFFSSLLSVLMSKLVYSCYWFLLFLFIISLSVFVGTREYFSGLITVFFSILFLRPMMEESVLFSFGFFGTTSFSILIFVLLAMTDVGSLMYSYLPVFGDLYGGAPWASLLWALGLIGIYHICLGVKRGWSGLRRAGVLGGLLVCCCVPYPQYFCTGFGCKNVLEYVVKWKNNKVVDQELLQSTSSFVNEKNKQDENQEKEEKETKKEEEEEKEEKEPKLIPVMEEKKIQKPKLPYLKYYYSTIRCLSLMTLLLFFFILFLPFGIHRLSSKPPKKSKDPKRFFRIATWNVFQSYSLLGETSNWHLISSFLKDEKIDVLGMQETQSCRPETGYHTMVDQIAFSGGNYYAFKGAPASVATIGTATLSLYPFEKKKVNFLRFVSDGLLRMWSTTEILMNDTIVTILNVHIDVEGIETNDKGWHAKELVDAVAQNKGPVVLLGDFNAKPNSTAYNIIRKAGFKDAYFEASGGKHLPTYIKDDSEQTLDYVFYKGMKLLQARVLKDKERASDHLAVVADFEVKKEK